MLYKAWVQVRYHRRRQRFFDLIDKATKATTLVLGATLFGKHLASLNWVATGISALGLMALVFGYGDRKQLHKELAEQAGNEAAQAAELKSLTERLEREIERFRLQRRAGRTATQGNLGSPCVMLRARSESPR